MKIMSIAGKIRQKLWTYKQPLTLDPGEIGIPVSDLFLWRQSPHWNTYFELINIPQIIDAESGMSQTVKFFFLDMEGNVVKKMNVSIGGKLCTHIDLAPMVSDVGMESGTFCVFHTDVPDSVTQAGSYIAERGYVSYRYQQASVRSYVHGNLDAVTLRHDGSLFFLEATSLLRRAYNLQHPLEPGCRYEIALVNPSNRKQVIECKISDIENKVIEQDMLTITPGGSSILNLDISSQQPCRLHIHSHLVMARPLVYKFFNNSLDVFHG